MLFIIIQFLPVLNVLGEVDLFSCPESGFLVLIHLPNVVILDGEENKAIGVLLKKRLFVYECLSLGYSLHRAIVRFNRSKIQTFFGNTWSMIGGDLDPFRTTELP